MSNQITSGRVVVEDGTKAAEEYAPARKVCVELFFAVEDGNDAPNMLRLAAKLADDQVSQLLGRRPTPAVAADEAQPAPVKTRGKKAEAKVETPPADDPASFLDDSAAEVPAVDPAAIDFSEEVPAEEPAVVEDAKPITDADLNSALSKKNGEINDAPRIRKLIAEFNPDPTKPFSIAQMPAAKRPEFLTKLAALAKE